MPNDFQLGVFLLFIKHSISSRSFKYFLLCPITLLWANSLVLQSLKKMFFLCMSENLMSLLLLFWNSSTVFSHLDANIHFFFSSKNLICHTSGFHMLNWMLQGHASFHSVIFLVWARGLQADLGITVSYSRPVVILPHGTTAVTLDF